MKTKHVIGQRIVHVKQGVISRGHGYTPANSVAYIELENGTKLIPQVQEAEADYFVEMVVNRMGAKRVKATMKQQTYEFRVEVTPGAAKSGPFPTHMLSIDQAWPATTDDAHTIEELLSGDIPKGQKTQVLLHSHKEPTKVRWEMNMVPVLECRTV